MITWNNQQVVYHKLPRSYALYLCLSLCQNCGSSRSSKSGGHCIDGFERFVLAFALALRRGPSDDLEEAGHQCHQCVAVGNSCVVVRYL